MQSSLAINWSAFGDHMEAVGALAQALGPRDFPEFLATAEVVSERAEVLYREFLGGKPTPAGKCVQRPSGTTARGVVRQETGLLIWTIKNESPVAKALEEGTKARDMRDMLPTSKRARRAKDGTLYLIIPMRHGTPGTRGMSAMPQKVYDRVVKFAFSKNVGAPAERVSATGWKVPRFFYNWQDKLDEKTLRAMGLDEPDVKKFSGMYRMKGQPGQNGRRQTSGYLTFRVLSEKSQGWKRPAVPGLEPLRYAVDQAIAEGMASLEEAFERDVMAALGLASSGIN